MPLACSIGHDLAWRGRLVRVASMSTVLVKEVEMPKVLHGLMLAMVAALIFSGCALVGKPAETAGRWIRFDPARQRYSIEAQQVPRGALLDELKTVAGADVRPQPEREAPVTATARDLDLNALVALLLPAGTRPIIRQGEREIAVGPKTNEPKVGPPLRPAAEAVAKPDVALEVPPDIKRTGTLKAAAETPYAPGEVSGPRTKPQVATLLRAADTLEPKTPLAARPERATVRLVLQFEEGAPPRVIDAQTIEGRAPVQRFVTGTYLWAVIAPDGRVLEAGTFQDPLIERSYQQQGPHSVRRAKSGAVGISIAREHLGSARVHIVDMTGMALPRELNEEVVRGALSRGRAALQLETQGILRRLEGEPKR
jgi:hypothetical protein